MDWDQQRAMFMELISNEIKGELHACCRLKHANMQ